MVECELVVMGVQQLEGPFSIIYMNLHVWGLGANDARWGVSVFL
jgi:hypothetical protein